APPPAAAAPYPPAQTGWRGSHPGSFESMHLLGHQKRSFPLGDAPVEERCDLVVVGAGASGLAAAYAWRKRFPDARVLVLDNHDDFGGHARRNEFHLPDGRVLLSYAGSESLQSPKALFPPEVKALLAELGVDLDGLLQRFDGSLYPGLGLSRGIFFNKERYGEDKLVSGDPFLPVADDIAPGELRARPLEAFVADFPLPDADKQALVALHLRPQDYFRKKAPGRWRALDGLRGKALEAERARRAAFAGTLPYARFLREYVGLSERAASVFQQRSVDFTALPMDGIPTAWAREVGLPGTERLGLPEPDAETQAEREEPYRYHFPDGNASIPRLLVSRLVPHAVATPVRGMDDVVQARFDYGRLDLPENPVRIRLRSTVVRVEQPEGPVQVGYLNAAQRLHRVEARRVVLACYHSVIPYLFAEDALPAEQRAAFAKNVKAPLVYARAVVRDWKAWKAAGVHELYCPDQPFARVKLDYPVSMGGYVHPKAPEEPAVVHLVHVPQPPGMEGQDARTRFRAGRWQLFAQTHEAREALVRGQLQRMFGAHGFDAQRDVLAVTVNAWSHGYSYYANPLHEPEGEEARVLAQVGRPIGAVAAAGSDATWSPYIHSALQNGLDAVKRLA
ncbi:MAG: NAD(P)-binding protein, partial [Deltaproteobacteria bacterium]|nr:NAD(P)-binding protein [Deltaproteobacteria bacterium]